MTLSSLLKPVLPVWIGALTATFMALGATGGVRAEALPLRNLLIEWRVAGQVADNRAGAGVSITTTSPGPQGGYTVSTTRRSETTVTIGGGSVQTRTQEQGQQQMLVLNGGQARLFVGESRPYTVWQWAWGSGSGGGGGGTGVGHGWGQTVFLDLGQGLSVQPSWPGGRAPVRVAFQASSARAGQAYEPDGVSRRTEVASTLLVPLGEWTVVARSGQRTEAQQAGTLSTRSVDRDDSGVLEIRISLP